MNRLCIFLASLLFCATNVVNAGATVPPYQLVNPLLLKIYQPGLIAEYHFDETSGTAVTDYSGNGNNGAYVGSPTLTGMGFAAATNTKYVTVPNAVRDTWQTAIVYADSGIGTVLANLSYGAMIGSDNTSGTEFMQANISLNAPMPILSYNSTVSTATQTLTAAPGGPTMFTALVYLSDTIPDLIYINDSVVNHRVRQNVGGQHRLGTMQIGASTENNGSFPHSFNGIIYYAAFYSTQLTPTQIAQNYQAIRNNLSKRGNALVPPSNTQLINLEMTIIGDSWVQGNGATPWVQQLTLDDTFTIYPMGYPGINAANWNLSIGAALSQTYAPHTRRNVAIVANGTNDVAGGGAPQTAYTNIVGECRTARLQGFQCIVLDMGSRIGFDSGKNTLNNLIRENWRTFADEFADIGADPYIGADGAYANLTYFQSDGIHPTTAGHTVIAGIVSSAINRLGTSKATSLPGARYTVTTPATVANTVTETSLVGTGIPAAGMTFNSYFWFPGRSVEIDTDGYYSTASSAGTLDVKLKWGSVVLADTGVRTATNSLTNLPWHFHGRVTCQSSGSTGATITNTTLLVQGSFYHQDTIYSPENLWPMINTSVVTLDTTSANGLLDMTATWGTQSASNSITASTLSVKVTN